MFILLLQDKRGFTFIEALVVIIIIGIIGMVAVPSFSPMEQSTGLKTTARELVSQLRFAQQQTINENIEHAVYVELPPVNKFSLRRAAAVLEEKELPRGIGISSSELIGGNLIVTAFTPTGEPSSRTGRGSKTIMLNNDIGQTLKVVITPIGRVSIEK